jgi:hypothetical protein
VFSLEMPPAARIMRVQLHRKDERAAMPQPLKPTGYG